ncbi:MAG: DUF4139 domain-containing protein [Candidatus Omnitrophota bacterium]
MKRIMVYCVFAVCFFPAVSFAQPIKSTIEDQTSVEVTVYNSNLGLIKDTRTVDLPEDAGELRFMDVAAGIKPVTVAVTSLTAPEKFMILEQNYEYDLMNAQKLMDKYVGRTVKIIDENEFQGTRKEVEAELLSNNKGPIYRIGNEIYLGHEGRVVLPELPDNLIAKPTLTWLYQNTGDQQQQLEVSYLTNNINWEADYVMTVNSDDTAAGLTGWVTIDNKSGTEYRDAQLKLVAGDVNRVQERSYRNKGMERAVMMASDAAGFAEEAFFEYHIYDLQRPATIKNKQTKQISLLEAEGISIDKEFLLYGRQNFFRSRYNDIPKGKPGVYLKFMNTDRNNLGMPLPAGVVRLYKADSKGKLQFIGEDRIDHTPEDEEIVLKIGEAFDVVAERRQTDFQHIGKYAVETAWEVELRNHKEDDITVSVIEPVWGEWRVIDASHDHEKLDAHRIKFNIPVSQDESATLTYRVRVTFR